MTIKYTESTKAFPCPICKQQINPGDTIYTKDNKSICLTCRTKQTMTDTYPTDPDTKYFPRPFSEAWKKAFLKALGYPAFNYQLPEKLEPEPLPVAPTVFKYKYEQKDFIKELKRVTKENSFKTWLNTVVSNKA